MNLRFYLILPLVFLAACASVPQEELPSQLPSEDLSMPNLASMYFFSSGSYLHHQGDFASADQVLNLALAQDPASPQIRRFLFINSARWYSVARNEASAEAARRMLQQAKDSYHFDEEMLFLAFNMYRDLGDIDGAQWALAELKDKHSGPQVSLWEYIFDKETGGNPSLSLLDEVIDSAEPNAYTRYIVAGLYSERDPHRALEIMQNMDLDVSGDQQLLSLYLHLDLHQELAQHFQNYSYPEDKDKISNYLMLLHENQLNDLALSHLPQLLETADVDLLELIAYIALMADDSTSLKLISEYLTDRIPAPAEDSKIVSILLINSIKHPKQAVPEGLFERIYQVQDIIQAAFLFVSSAEYHDDRQHGYVNAFRDLHLALDDAVLPDDIKAFMKDHSASLAGLYDAESHSALNLAERLINKGFGGRPDFDLVLDHYLLVGDEASQLHYLRLALDRFPSDPLVKNNLGYLLLSYPEHLEEAERLIAEALRQDPDNTSFIDSMAWLHYQKGEYDKAASFLPKLIQEESPNAELYYHIGMISRKVGDLQTAEKYLNMVLDLPNSAEYHSKSTSALEQMPKQKEESR